MVAVNLKPDLAKQITHLAGKDQTRTEAFVDKALRTYIRRQVERFVGRCSASQ